MRQRTKGALVLGLMLMLLAASSQAAVCELSCALKMQTGACAMSAGMPMANGASMDMPAADCPAMHGTVVGAQMPDGSCNHPLVIAVEKGGCAEAAAVAPQWTVVEVLPVPASLAVGERLAGKAPPLRPAANDPVLLSFRV